MFDTLEGRMTIKNLFPFLFLMGFDSIHSVQINHRNDLLLSFIC